MRAILIINPVSGDAESNTEKVAAIQAGLAGAPFTAEVCETTEERGAGVLAREAVAAGVGVILVGGGDGTVSEVARELVNQPATLGIIPAGTFNNIARSVGVLAELPVAAGVIAAGHTRKLDVGLANEKSYFFEAAGAGLDATLFPIGEEIKGGRWMRILQAARLTLQYEAQPFVITFDRPLSEILPADRQRRLSRRALAGRTIRRNALLVVVANGPYYGGGFTVAAGAQMRDGQLNISIYRRFSKWELIRHFQSIFRGRYHYSPKIETYTAAGVELASSRAISVHIDGQPFGTTPVQLRTLPGALRVFAPEKPLPVGESGSAPVVLPAAAENRAPGARKAMPDSPARADDSKEPAPAERAADALARGVAEIATPAAAADTLDRLAQTAGDRREAEVEPNADPTPEQQAAALEQASQRASSAGKTAQVIATAAAQSAMAAPVDKPVMDEAVVAAMGGSDSRGDIRPDVRHGRRLLQRELFRRLHFFQALDAFAYVGINQLPHPRGVDVFLGKLSWVMTGGAGWGLVMLAGIFHHPPRGWKAVRAVAPALWLATATVEYPIKKWFRRRRPFLSVVEAVVVGRKPGSYSFPSGHSAAAFAGALLLSRQYPRSASGFFGLAALVAFSRVYLGAHYPGDVVSGSICGLVLARVYQKILGAFSSARWRR